MLHNDETSIQILELTRIRRKQAIETGHIDPDQHIGLFTSGVVSLSGAREVVLFFTGDQRAGENLADVPGHLEAGLTAMIQMRDALSHNTCGEFDSILSHCLAHARRQFMEVTMKFPDECRFVIEALREVYKTDAIAKEQDMSADARLLLCVSHGAAEARSIGGG